MWTEHCKNLKNTQKILELPGEFDISGILVRGFYSDKTNVVYKVIADGISFVHFGTYTPKENSDFLKKLGENVDVILINLHEKLDAKTTKTIIETLDPHLTIIGGTQELFPKMIETGA